MTVVVDEDGIAEPELAPFVNVQGTVTVCWITMVVTGTFAAGAVVRGAAAVP